MQSNQIFWKGEYSNKNISCIQKIKILAGDRLIYCYSVNSLFLWPNSSTAGRQASFTGIQVKDVSSFCLKFNPFAGHYFSKKLHFLCILKNSLTWLLEVSLQQSPCDLQPRRTGQVDSLKATSGRGVRSLLDQLHTAYTWEIHISGEGRCFDQKLVTSGQKQFSA